jgi:hypothetical protein
MGIVSLTLQALSAAAFMYFGFACLRAPAMVVEFERYRLPRKRVLVGSLQLLGALGLLVGFVLTPVAVISAGGLCLLMLAGVGVRARIRDPLVAMLPALLLSVMNAIVAIAALRTLP